MVYALTLALFLKYAKSYRQSDNSDYSVLGVHFHQLAVLEDPSGRGWDFRLVRSPSLALSLSRDCVKLPPEASRSLAASSPC